VVELRSTFFIGSCEASSDDLILFQGSPVLAVSRLGKAAAGDLGKLLIRMILNDLPVGLDLILLYFEKSRIPIIG